MRNVKWFDLDTFEEVGEFPLQLADNDDYICPKCGSPAVYWEGQIGQDYMGNDIRGWSFDCWACKIHSEVVEDTWSDSY